MRKRRAPNPRVILSPEEGEGSQNAKLSHSEILHRATPVQDDVGASEPVLIALGSNLGDRLWHLRRAVDGLRHAIRLVRVSSIYETAPVDAPPGSPQFLNMVAAGLTTLAPHELLEVLLGLEARLGRVRSVRNAPRVIDLDLIFYGARRIRTATLAVPHPRYQEREFVLAPLREIGFPIQRVP